LTDIESNAFRTTPTKLIIKNNPKLSSQVMFNLANNLEDTLFLELSESNITQIPDFAFTPNNSRLNKLTEINLEKNNITSIGSNAFSI